jgi:hypothetical protein
MFGGCVYDGTDFVPSKVMYVLDLSHRNPTWRQAHIEQPRASPWFSQGGDSVVMLPEYGLVALKQNKVDDLSCGTSGLSCLRQLCKNCVLAVPVGQPSLRLVGSHYNAAQNKPHTHVLTDT